MSDEKIIVEKINDKCDLILKYYEEVSNYEPYVDFITEMQLICTVDMPTDNISKAVVLKLDCEDFNKFSSIIEKHLETQRYRRTGAHRLPPR